MKFERWLRYTGNLLVAMWCMSDFAVEHDWTSLLLAILNAGAFVYMAGCDRE